MIKLTQIQQALKAPKNQFNDFGKYKYRSCEDILEAVKPLLNGCLLTISDAVVEVGGRVYVEATATFSDGNNKISVKAYARESETKKGMDESQITGSASSYARKYALNGLFLIDDTKDADTMDNTKQQTQKPEQKEPTKSKEMSSDQRKYIKSIGRKAHEMTDSEISDMVKWKAEKENLDPNHWKMAKILLPEDKFQEVFIEYSEHMMNQSTGVKGF